MDLSYWCDKYPIIMRIVFGLLMCSGIFFIFVAICILIEYKDDFKDVTIECFNFIKSGKIE